LARRTDSLGHATQIRPTPSGTGIGFNNNYAGISISPHGTEYLGSLGGVMSLRDGG
jgi:hypothetical protein